MRTSTVRWQATSAAAALTTASAWRSRRRRLPRRGNDMTDLSRRRFVVAGAAVGGGLLIGFALPGCDRNGRNEKPPEAAVGSATTHSSDQAPNLAPNAFIRIARDGTVIFVMHKVEMGQ